MCKHRTSKDLSYWQKKCQEQGTRKMKQLLSRTILLRRLLSQMIVQFHTKKWNKIFQKCLHLIQTTCSLIEQSQFKIFWRNLNLTQIIIFLSGHISHIIIKFLPQTTSSIWTYVIILRKSHSLTMVKPGMNVIDKATKFVRPGQVPSQYWLLITTVCNW